jgi:AAA domain
VTAALEAQAEPVEISWTASEAIASWRRVLAQSDDKRQNLERASIEILCLAKAEPRSKPAIVDQLAEMAVAAGINTNEAQEIFARAAKSLEMPVTKHRGRVNGQPVSFPLQAFDKIRLDPGRRGYSVKGLIASTGLAVIWGPPKCGKSFFAADLGMHIALGWDYRGHKVQQAPVVYIALEGRHGLPARVEAFRRHYGVDVAPFYLLTASLDLVAKSGQLIASIKAQLGAHLPGVIFLDTLNRSLVGSESKDEDMARFLAAAEKVAQELNCAVVIVHHCGIDASRPRGHTSLSGAVESQLKVERDNTGAVIVTVELAKDFAEGTEIVSRLDRVALGTDADGDPITSLVVLPFEGPIQRRAVTRKLSDRQRLALAVLEECAANNGAPAPASMQLPARTVVVQLNAWREELYRKGVLEHDAKSPREEFKRVRQQLQARGLIGVHDAVLWKA